MHLFFADDSRQPSPTRCGMGPLIGSGGVLISVDKVRDLEFALNNLCRNTGFPSGDYFKWSPGREMWMHQHLLDENRESFFIGALTLALQHEIKAIVVIEDSSRNTATNAQHSEEDVTRLLLERVNNQLRKIGSEAIVIIARPSGGRSDEDRFLEECLETLLSGTNYVTPDRIILNILSTPSRFIKLLQLADVIISCSIAIVAGENRYSPRIFNAIKELLINDGSRIGGVGFKIHPDFRYANLYHWLLNDTQFWKGIFGVQLPILGRPYFTGADTP